jgi:Kef-type K+ transport system membrane component KefB
LLVLAFAANRLFRRTRIPDVLVLMATGVVIVPSSSSIGFLQFCM